MVKIMNDLIQLKGRFEKRSNESKPGAPNLPKNQEVSADHLCILANQLEKIEKYWRENTLIGGALVSVHYKRIVPKSNRIQIFFAEKGKTPMESIRGAKFVWESDNGEKKHPKHVFTHFVSMEALNKTIENLQKAIFILNHYYGGKMKSSDVEKVGKSGKANFTEMAKTNFLKVVVDSYNVERFDIDRASDEITEESIITIYDTGVDTRWLLSKLGIDIVDDRIIDRTTMRLRPDEAKLLYDRANYLVAMCFTDFSKLTLDDILREQKEIEESLEIIPHPNNEPVIGVIDTLFNENVYFHEWVDFRNMLDPNIPISPEDYYHGTAVSSIIVDGVHGNPELDDGCGRFRVRHFGVATHIGFSSFTILRLIRQIVAENSDIKVWNLSLGSKLEIKENFISPEAAELDRIQSEYDVVFVVAGTNKPEGSKAKNMKIGSPADSLNSLVVNSVDMRGNSASYTRTGPVLSFFHKPDISYYGGDGSAIGEKIVVCKDDLGAAYVAGTSFAAPWISRKMAYLIYVMGMSRELAKALLIDAAAGWEPKDDISHKIGYGVVPRDIRDVLRCKDDEIRFVLTGASEEYETYTYNLPVPIVDHAHPFYARATLVYFPECNRNQGVDYTNTEMDIHFGRVYIKNGKATIKAINNNPQSESGKVLLYEGDARKMYRKWDNIKHVSEEIKLNGRPRKAYDAGVWGLSIKTKERMDNRKKVPLPFGVLVTLKEMNGVNRNDEFIKLCMARGWLVNRLDVENQIDIYEKAEEEINFE